MPLHFKELKLSYWTEKNCLINILTMCSAQLCGLILVAVELKFLSETVDPLANSTFVLFTFLWNLSGSQ